MKKALLILTLLVSPGVFSATPTFQSDALTTAARKKHKSKKKKKASSAQNKAPANSSLAGSSASGKSTDQSADQSGSANVSGETQNLSGNAVPTAEENARQSLRNEQKSNVNFGSAEPAKGSNASTVYPRSADPDARDSYQTENRLGPKAESGALHGNQKTLDREASTGSTVLDSFSGSSSLPPDQKQGEKNPTQ